MVEGRESVSLRDYLEALSARDQRAIELLAQHNADRIKTGIVILSTLISMVSVMVAIAALIWERR